MAQVRLVVFVCCALVVALPATALAAAAAPIRVQVGPDAERGYLDRVSSDEDTELSDQEVERALRERPWLEIVSEDDEVAVEVVRRSISVSSRSKEKDGDVRITWLFTVRAAIATRAERDRIEATTTSSETVSERESRRSRHEEYGDRDVFDRLAREIAQKANDWILARVEELRPGRPDAGFRHEAKHKWLVKGDGLEVTEVMPDSPAAHAGLRKGDRIRAIDAERGTAEMDLRARTWWSEPPGTTVTLEYERGKVRQRLVCAILPPAEWRGSPAAEANPSAERRPSAPAPIRPGMRPQEVEAALGRPLRIGTLGSKTVWTYDGLEVMFTDGNVTEIK